MSIARPRSWKERVRLYRSSILNTYNHNGHQCGITRHTWRHPHSGKGRDVTQCSMCQWNAIKRSSQGNDPTIAPSCCNRIPRYVSLSFTMANQFTFSGLLTPWNGTTNNKYVKNVKAVITSTWKLFKDLTHGLIHEAYGLCPNIQSNSPDAEVLTKRVVIPPLLQDNQWLHKWDMVCLYYNTPLLTHILLRLEILLVFSNIQHLYWCS